MSNGDLGLAAAAAIGLTQMLALVLIYGLRSNWRAHSVGIVLLGSFTIKAVIFAMILLGRIIGPLGVEVWATALLVFDVVQFAWLRLVIRAQRAPRDDPEPREKGVRR